MLVLQDVPTFVCSECGRRLYQCWERQSICRLCADQIEAMHFKKVCQRCNRTFYTRIAHDRFCVDHRKIKSHSPALHFHVAAAMSASTITDCDVSFECVQRLFEEERGWYCDG